MGVVIGSLKTRGKDRFLISKSSRSIAGGAVLITEYVSQFKWG